MTAKTTHYNDQTSYETWVLPTLSKESQESYYAGKRLALPEGFVAVPEEMTEAMKVAACVAVHDIYAKEGGWCGLRAAEDQVFATWSAAIAAAKEGK